MMVPPTHEPSSLNNLPLLNTNDRQDARSELEANMGSKGLDRVGSKTHIHEYITEDVRDSECLAGPNLVAEAEGRVGFQGLFENKLV